MDRSYASVQGSAEAGRARSLSSTVCLDSKDECVTPAGGGYFSAPPIGAIAGVLVQLAASPSETR
jgi:hypothetical protein